MVTRKPEAVVVEKLDAVRVRPPQPRSIILPDCQLYVDADQVQSRHQGGHASARPAMDVVEGSDGMKNVHRAAEAARAEVDWGCVHAGLVVNANTRRLRTHASLSAAATATANSTYGPPRSGAKLSIVRSTRMGLRDIWP